MAYRFILLEINDAVAVITLNRPEVLNALSQDMMEEIAHAVDQLEENLNIRVIVLRGNENHFAAGADIQEFFQKTFITTHQQDFLQTWQRISTCRLPLIASVAGYVMGAGCELALMCDVILAADNARFSQPEISIGLMPGAGGTQRLPRAMGKAKAMDLCLTGRFMNAAEAEQCGLVSRVVPLKDWAKETALLAERISVFSRPVAMMIKEAITRAYEAPLAEGLKTERQMFRSLFSLEDPHEGIQAFMEKRPAVFKHR